MKLKEIRLRNFRCYEDLTVPLDEKLTVLVAPNGQGKTAILDAISIALWSFVGQFDLSSDKSSRKNHNITVDDVRITPDGGMVWVEKEFYFAPVKMQPHTDTEVIATNFDNLKWIKYRNSLKSYSKTKEKGDYRELHNQAKELQNSSSITLPMFAYYGTGRLWNEMRLTTKSKLTDKNLIRTFAYMDCLNSASSYKQFVDWFKNCESEFYRYTKENILNGKIFDEMHSLKTVQAPLKVIRDSIHTCLDGVVGWSFPSYSDSHQDIILISKLGTLKLSQLSDGIQNVFGMVADIAYRCYLLNSHLGENAAKETEGIVLIDEVDMHLHPEWQQVILRDLQAAFPNLQFIVTTHSPQVLTTVPAECIRMINGQKIDFAPAGTKGAEASRILERIFLVESRPPQDENTQMLAEYRQLVYKDKWAENRAKELRQKLDTIFQGNEPELTALDLYIDNREWELSLEENQ
ncbi:AAA family ATPase [Wielerella bovis]|uniref:AAA family ATPase n=1 Tax=Wielerella bovis TaxID=2917790 RepID=UPI00201984EA|nr:AAA family ATPase [Wielerella bovis]ULJ59777.1 AAA family ATPase [Wielerella bovis]